MAEATYVRHHKQKFALVFSAMRQFAERLRALGVVVRYVAPGRSRQHPEPERRGAARAEDQPFARVVVTEPG